jgi:hypothetical protein
MVCRLCGVDKPKSGYYSERKRPRQPCRTCAKTKARENHHTQRSLNNARSARWYLAHKERTLWSTCASCARRRGATQFCTYEEWVELRKGTTCSWCGCWLHPAFRQVDHIVPLCRGGQHAIDNLVLSCANCNVRREWERKVKYHAEV